MGKTLLFYGVPSSRLSQPPESREDLRGKEEAGRHLSTAPIMLHALGLFCQPDFGQTVRTHVNLNPPTADHSSYWLLVKCSCGQQQPLWR